MSNKKRKNQDHSLLTIPTIPKQSPPVIGISYLQVKHHKFGLKSFFENTKRDGDIYKAFYDFLKQVSLLNNVNELLKSYGSHINTKNTDSISKEIVKIMETDFPKIECDELVHIHCKQGGKGKFVLHGFIHGNTFEIVLLDPYHELHS